MCVHNPLYIDVLHHNSVDRAIHVFFTRLIYKWVMWWYLLLLFSLSLFYFSDTSTHWYNCDSVVCKRDSSTSRYSHIFSLLLFVITGDILCSSLYSSFAKSSTMRLTAAYLLFIYGFFDDVTTNEELPQEFTLEMFTKMLGSSKERLVANYNPDVDLKTVNRYIFKNWKTLCNFLKIVIFVTIFRIFLHHMHDLKFIYV